MYSRASLNSPLRLPSYTNGPSCVTMTPRQEREREREHVSGNAKRFQLS